MQGCLNCASSLLQNSFAPGPGITSAHADNVHPSAKQKAPITLFSASLQFLVIIALRYFPRTGRYCRTITLAISLVLPPSRPSRFRASFAVLNGELTRVGQWDLFPRPILEISPDRRCNDQGQWPAGSDDEGVKDSWFLVRWPSEVAEGLPKELRVGHFAGTDWINVTGMFGL